METLVSKPVGRAPFAVELLKPVASDRVLNVGCHDGALEYHYLLGKVEEFQGIDVNTKAVDVASRWSSEIFGQSHFQVTQAEHMPFEDSSFDKVLCLDTFEHVNDEQKVADEIYRVLKPGGVLVLSVPHDFLNFLDHDEITRVPRNFVRKYIKKKPLLDHPKHRHYSEEALKKFFGKFDFEYVHKSGTPVFWSLAFVYYAMGLPEKLVNRLSRVTAPLENWDYRTKLPTGFNIMIRMRKPV
jgi:ubiquinone/menaquinone biosynthesis C-methylase UbiE